MSLTLFTKATRNPMLPLLCVALGSFLLLAGCESGGGGDGDSEAEAANSDRSYSSSFPDGLHPSGAAANKIAQTFAKAIGRVDEEATVVCIGDSITAGDYPGNLASMIGGTVVNAGVGAERSGEGAGRIAGLLDRYNPEYVCILFGINDLIHGHSAESVAPNLSSMVAAARASGATPIVGTLTPVFTSKYEHLQPEVDKLNKLIRGLGVKVADLAKQF